MSKENPNIIIEQPQQKSGANIKEVVIYSAIGLVLVGGTLFIGNKLLHKGISNTEEKKALEPDSTTSQAKQLKMAFDNDGWWGTDEELIRKTLRGLKDKKTYRDVAASYKKLYNSPLTKDMQEELTSTEYDEMMNIIAAKPEEYKKGQPITYNYLAWAKRLRSAVSTYYWIFPGTDEDAIKSVFIEIPTQTAFAKVKSAYKTEYGDDLMSDLQGDLDLFTIIELQQLISKKPKA